MEICISGDDWLFLFRLDMSQKDYGMKTWAIVLLACLGFACAKQQEKPVSLIFDTDMAPDYDDVGALAVLHALADSGKVNILATVSSNKWETTVPCIDVINTYFGRPEIPLGAVKGEGVSQDTWHQGLKWTEELPARYPHQVKSASEAEDAVKVYRKVLSKQSDTSVVVVTVGFFTNLKNLLLSQPDEISPLSGQELVASKVKKLVSMGGYFPEGKEFNVMMDAPSSQYVFEHWPTPVLFSGFEIGEKIITGKQTAAAEGKSPIKEAYEMSLAQDNPNGRNSWDQSTVLVAVCGTEPWFDVERGVMTVTPADSLDHWTPDPNGKHARLIMKVPVEQVTETIEALMMHRPVN